MIPKKTPGVGGVPLTALLGAAISLTALVGAGCSQDTPPAQTVVNNEAPPVVAAAPATTIVVATPPVVAVPTNGVTTNDTNAGPGGPTGTQTAIADEISRAIIRNTQMTGSRVNVVVDDAGIATLTGFVQNPQQKALAEKAAREPIGVNGLHDKLEIRPTGGVGKTPATPAAHPAPAVTNVYVLPGATPGAATAPRSPATPAANPTPADRVLYGVSGTGDDSRGGAPASENGTAPADNSSAPNDSGNNGSSSGQ